MSDVGFGHWDGHAKWSYSSYGCKLQNFITMKDEQKSRISLKLK